MKKLGTQKEKTREINKKGRNTIKFNLVIIFLIAIGLALVGKLVASEEFISRVKNLNYKDYTSQKTVIINKTDSNTGAKLQGAKFKIEKIEQETKYVEEWNTGISGSIHNGIVSIVETKDGGYLAGGNFSSETIDLKNGVTLVNNGYDTVYGYTTDGMIIKYKNNGETEWAKVIGGSGSDTINSVIETSDGGYLAGGNFSSETIDLGNGVTLTKSGFGSNGMLIKYKSNGKVEWAKTIDVDISSIIQTSDGGYLIGGVISGNIFNDPIDLGNNVTITLPSGYGYFYGLLIKYKSNGETEWAKTTGPILSSSRILVAETKDGRYLVGGTFNGSTVDLGSGITLTNNGTDTNDGMLIKYKNNGEVEWARSIGGSAHDSISLVVTTSDGGYLVGGSFSSNTIDLGNGVTLTNNGGYDGMAIKYNSRGEVEWAKAIGGDGIDAINYAIETKDDGYLVSGNFQSSTIDLENGVTLTKSGIGSSGMLIKYKSNGELEGAEAKAEYSIRVIETSDDGYLLLTNTLMNQTLRKYKPTLVPATDESGEIITTEVGEVTTNELGQATISLPAGKYRITEIEAPENYDLPENSVTEINIEEDNTIEVNLTNEKKKGNVTVFHLIEGTETPVPLADGTDSQDETKTGYIGEEYTTEAISDSLLGEAYELVGIPSNANGTYSPDEIVVTYYYKQVERQVIINKTDTETGEKLQGAKFKIGKIEGNTGYIADWAKAIGGSGSDQIHSVIETSDGGYLAGGHFSNTIDLGNGVTLTNDGNYDVMIIKYNSNGEVQWAKGIGGNSYEYIDSIIETSDGGYLVGGYFNSSTIDLGNGVTLTNNGGYDGMAIKYNSRGEVEWAKGIGGSNDDLIHSVIGTSDGGYLVGGYFSNTIDLGDGVTLTLTNNGRTDGMIIKYNSNGEAQWAKVIGGSDYEDGINSVVEISDGGYLVGGHFYSRTIDLGNEISLTNSRSNADGMIIKYSSNGEAEWAKRIGGSGFDLINSIIETSDEGYLVGGYFNSSTIDLGNGVTLTNNGREDGMVIKYNSSGEVEWARDIGGSSDEYIISIIGTSDGGYLVGGYFNSSTIDLGNGVILTNNNGERSGMIIKYDSNGEAEWAKAIGGDKADVIFSVVQTSDGGYLVGGGFHSSTIDLENGVTLNNNGGQDGMIIKYKPTLAPATEVGEVTTNEFGQATISLPAGKYRITEIEAPENYELPENPTTEITITKETEVEEVNLTNTKQKGKVIVRHLIEGTEKSVPSKTDGEIIENEEKIGNIGDDYTTNPSDNVSEEYKLVSAEVENKSGQYTKNDINVTYYYKKIGSKVKIDKVDKDTQEKLSGADFELSGTSDEGEEVSLGGTTDENGQIIFKVVPYGTYTVQETKAPNGYIAETETKEIEVKERTKEYTITLSYGNMGSDTYSTGYIDPETGIEMGGGYYIGFQDWEWWSVDIKDEDGNSYNGAEIEVVYDKTYNYTGSARWSWMNYNVPSPGLSGPVIATIKIPNLEDIVLEGYINNGSTNSGSKTAKVNIAEEYGAEVTFENTKSSNITVHHLEATRNSDGTYTYTENKLADDESYTGKVGDNYTTSFKTDLEKYELIKNEDGENILPSNASGTYTVEAQEITYYYRLKQPEVQSEIEKTSTLAKLTNADTKIPYNITYKTEIDKYKGNATITIVDILPYEIDEENSELVEGIYNDTNNTITWTQTIEDIDTYEDGKKEIEITKQIELKYKDINETVENVTNTVTGTIKLEDPEIEDIVMGTKEIPTEYVVDVTINKVWVDNDTQKARRPEKIKLQVKNGNTVVGEYELDTSTETSHTFTGLAKYDSERHAIAYTIDEIELTDGDLKFYTKQTGTVAGNNEKVGTITNTFATAQDKTSFTVDKVWVDNEAQSARRPNIIKLQVKNGNTVVQEYEASSSDKVEGSENTWSHTFTDLAKYDSNGQEIVYTADEVEKNEGDLKFYTKEASGNTVTNTFTESNDTVTLTVNKHWGDNETQALRRPGQIKLQVKSEDEVIQEYTLNTATETNHTFTNLPKYNSNGQEIVYTVDEVELEEGDLKFYNKNVGNVIGVDSKQVTITNTFKSTEEISNLEKTNITINKVWEDSEEQSAKRPSKIKLQLKNGNEVAGEYELNTATESEHIFTNLVKFNSNGQEIAYTADEAEIQEGDLKFYNKSINGTTVTNTFKSEEEIDDLEKAEITVSKSWVDTQEQSARRPAKIKLQVKNGSTIVQEYELNTETETSHTFTGLARYNGKGDEITYTVDEAEATEGDLKFYNKSIEGNTIINTFKSAEEIRDLEKTEVTITKSWVDTEAQRENRPETIKLQVKNGTEVVDEYEINTGTETSYTFTGLAKYDSNGKEIAYTADETEVAEGDLKFYTKSINGTTVTNTFTHTNEKVEIKVEKKWVDTDEQKEHRPDTVKLQVKNGEKVVDEYALSHATESEYTFTGLDKYDENGRLIRYTVDEAEVNEGDLKFYTKKIEGTTITNTFTKPEDKIELTVTKEWKDNEIQALQRPETIKLQVKDENKVVQEYTLYSDSETSHTFTDLAKYDENGKEIKYTVDEAEVNEGDLRFYTKKVEGNKITNTFKLPNDTIDIIVNKVWEDTAEQSARRPEKVKLQIKDGNNVVDEYTLNTGDASHKFTGIAKYNENGQEIVYTVDEAEVSSGDLKFYSKKLGSVEGDDQKTATITNTFTTPEDKVELTVNKIWAYENDKQAKRIPQTIKVQAKNGDEVVQEHVLYTGTETEYTFKDLAKYDKNGNEITYTVDEAEAQEGDLKFFTKQIEGGVITNTFTKSDEEIEITVNKVWKDSEAQKENRPKEIKLQIKNGEEVVRKYTLKTESQDSHTFVQLPRYTADGEEIEYTADEVEVNDGDLEDYTKSVGIMMGRVNKEVIITNAAKEVPTKVEVNFLEQGTDKVLDTQEIIEGYVGKEYKANAKEIKGYVLLAVAENAEGTMTEDTIVVNYYYRKKDFNLGVTKWVDHVVMGGKTREGQTYETRDEVYKLEVRNRQVENSYVLVTYKIRVTNSGEIGGYAEEVIEQIPSKLKFYQEDNNILWTEKDGALVTDYLNGMAIAPGEYKEIEITLRWFPKEDNFGGMENIVKLGKTRSENESEDCDEYDNEADSIMLVAVATRMLITDRAKMVGGVTLIAVLIAFGVEVVRRRKGLNRKKKKIKAIKSL